MFDRNSGKRPASYEGVELGEPLGPMQFTIDETALRKYAFCQADYHAWHFEASPWGLPIAHAALLGNDLLNVYYSVFDRHTVMGLHTEEQLTFLRPITVGETVTVAGEYVEKYVRRGKGYVVMEAEATDSRGNVLVKHRGVEIMKTQPGEVVGQSTARVSKGGRIIPSRPSPLEPVVSHVEDLPYSGRPLKSMTKLLTQEQISVFSYHGEYQKNIHNDMEYARKGGLHAPIGQGMQVAGHFSEYGSRFFGVDWFTSGRVRTKFLKPVYAGDVLEFYGRVASAEHVTDGDARNVSLEMWCYRNEEEVSAVAWLECAVAV